jgi:hypothetical protein
MAFLRTVTRRRRCRMVPKSCLLSEMLYYMSKYNREFIFYGVVKWIEFKIFEIWFRLKDFVSASKSCQDIAYTPDCQQKAAAGQCHTILGSSLPISYYCSKSCGKCSTRLTCNTLFNGCNQGSCILQYYFAQNSVQCLCPAGTGGTYCQQG